MPSRRQFMSAVAAGALGTVAGCTGSADEPPEATTPALDPENHVSGADRNWSSFGGNAANTREVHDGQAPVDGVTERWRVAVPRSQYNEGTPVVADGRVYLPGEELRVFDAADGTERWRASGIRTAPVVRDGVVYGSDTAAEAVVALDADSGARLWTQPVDARPRGPSMYPGDSLVVGVGESVHALDPETGTRRWTEELFGTVLSHPPTNGETVVVATTAGELVLLDPRDGAGIARWRLPAPTATPPVVDVHDVYVNCEDGTTYAYRGRRGAPGTARWSVDTGVASDGVTVASGLVCAGTGSDLHAVDAESGDVQWTHDIGDWGATAPAVGRDTLFVGGDRLWALDPTSAGGRLTDSPGVRFERGFAGRVGPGPVLDDGTLYVVAETGPESEHLLALG